MTQADETYPCVDCLTLPATCPFNERCDVCHLVHLSNQEPPEGDEWSGGFAKNH